jgi:hypothetical protein
VEKGAFKKGRIFHQLMDSNLRKKLEIDYNWSIAFFDARIWTLRKV